MRALGEAGLLHKDALTVNGKTHLGELHGRARTTTTRSSGRFDKPLTSEGGIAVLRGNLAPGGAVIKPSAATPALMQHRGRAVVFETIEDYHERDRRSGARHRRDLRHGAEELRARGAIPAWPRSATCRCRRSC